MKSHLLSLTIAASGLFSLTAAGAPDGAVPTALQAHSTEAVTNFVNACADGDESGLEATLADDAVLEFPLGEPGTFFSVDAGSAADFCNVSGAPGHIASLQVFPAGEHTVVASFNQGNRPHLVLVEIRGNRILRLRDFTADSEQVKRYAEGQPHILKAS